MESWISVHGTVTDPVDEPREPWDGDRFGPERPYMRDYSRMLTVKMMLAYQVPDDPGRSNVILRFDEALDRIRTIDAMTLSIPKLVYLVGWNAMGHDDKYPSWNIVNPFLCCPGSHDPVGDLRWLMREAQKYHTTVSLHLNSTDAYMDSPLWEEYYRSGYISTRDGKDLNYGQWSGKDVYQINYKRVWESGEYKRKVDELLTMLPELKDAGSIHSDAFLCRWSDQSSYEEEQAARRQMIRYWRDCGMDLTSEFMFGSVEGVGEDELGALNGNRMDTSGLIGLQAYAWHLAQKEEYWFSRPATLLAGGGYPHLVNPFIIEDGSDKIAFLYGCSMQGEDVLLDGCRQQDTPDAPDWKTVFRTRFFTTTLMYAYLNRFANRSVGETDGVTVLKKDGGVVCTYGDAPSRRVITEGDVTIRQGNDVFVPVGWYEGRAIAAYSEDGYTACRRTFPPAWEGVGAVDIYDVSDDGVRLLHQNIPITDRSLILSLQPKQSVCILPSGDKIIGGSL